MDYTRIRKDNFQVHDRKGNLVERRIESYYIGNTLVRYDIHETIIEKREFIEEGEFKI